MIALAGLVYLPWRVLLGVSLAMILLHNLCDGVRARQFGDWAWAWNLLHQPGAFRLGSRLILVGYPLIPWIGVMSAGYCFGRVFQFDAERRRKLLLRLGMAITGAFFLVRAINIYGDPRPWTAQKSALFTLLSFLNCIKYPPSLDFLLMTLGPLILVLGMLERVRVSAARSAAGLRTGAALLFRDSSFFDSQPGRRAGRDPLWRSRIPADPSVTDAGRTVARFPVRTTATASRCAMSSGS